MMIRSLLLAALLVLAPAVSFADIIYGPRASDSIVGTSGDDFATGPHSLGFTFNFFGSPNTTVFMNSNGNLTFGGGFSTFTNTPLPISTPIVAPYWDDLFLYTAVTSEMRINTSVTGEFTALWSNVGFFANPTLTPISLETILLGPGNSFGLVDGSILFSYANNVYVPGTATIGISSGTSFETLASVISSNSDGTLSTGDPAASQLAGNSFLFTPNAARINTYTVSVFSGTVNAVPAPPAVILAGIGIAGLWTLRRRAA
jgi:hypothetical protein